MTRQHITATRAQRALHSQYHAQTKTNMNRLIAALALGSAAAFAPAARAPVSTVAFAGAGKYEGKEFGFPEKKDLWENWDPNSPRSETNFNPFERNTDGNACDASGYFPGRGQVLRPPAPRRRLRGHDGREDGHGRDRGEPQGRRRAGRAGPPQLDWLVEFAHRSSNTSDKEQS